MNECIVHVPCLCSLPVLNGVYFVFSICKTKQSRKRTMRILCRNFSIKRVFNHFTMNLCRFVVVSTHHTCIHVRIYWVWKMLNSENYNINVENDGRHDRVFWGITFCNEIVWKRKIGQKRIFFVDLLIFSLKLWRSVHTSIYLFFFFVFVFHLLFAVFTIHTSDGA